MIFSDITDIVNALQSLVHPILEELWHFFKQEKNPDLFLIEQNPFFIGNIKINNPVISAPLAGISDNTFRIFARFFGSALLYSEMVTSYGLYYDQKKSLDMTYASEYERPFVLQLFGANPEIIALAAEKIERNAEIIDINMGCPVPKVIKTGSGGALLREEDLIKKIIRTVKKTIKKPLTVKLRLGWDYNSVNIERTAMIAESEGAQAIAVHARTVKQGYSGTADYSYLKNLKKKIKIPLIISGDIDNPFKAFKLLNDLGCEGVMIGRAARGNPWVFTVILLGIILLNEGKATVKVPDFEKSFTENIDYFLNNDIKSKILTLFLKSLVYFLGEEKAVKEFRKILGWAFKGIRNIAELKKDFFIIDNFKDAEKILNSFIGM